MSLDFIKSKRGDEILVQKGFHWKVKPTKNYVGVYRQSKNIKFQLRSIQNLKYIINTKVK